MFDSILSPAILIMIYKFGHHPFRDRDNSVREGIHLSGVILVERLFPVRNQRPKERRFRPYNRLRQRKYGLPPNEVPMKFPLGKYFA